MHLASVSKLHIILLSAVFAAPLFANADDVFLVNGRVYTNCTVQRVDPDGIVIKHSSGISKFQFQELAPATRKQYVDDSAQPTIARTVEQFDYLKFYSVRKVPEEIEHLSSQRDAHAEDAFAQYVYSVNVWPSIVVFMKVCVAKSKENTDLAKSNEIWIVFPVMQSQTAPGAFRKFLDWAGTAKQTGAVDFSKVLLQLRDGWDHSFHLMDGKPYYRDSSGKGMATEDDIRQFAKLAGQIQELQQELNEKISRYVEQKKMFK